MERKYQLYIGGKWVDAADGKTFQSVNPYDGSVNATIAEAGPEDVDRAVKAAAKAFPVWSGMSSFERGRVFWHIAELIRARREDLAKLESLDAGKPVSFAIGDIDTAAETFEYFAGLTTKISGEVLPVPGQGMLNYTVREPIGVIGIITPWNFPLHLSVLKIAPALACGNTAVLKPPEDAPMTALELAKIVEEAGLPSGTLNVIPGFGETAGDALVHHPDVGKIAFTGSLEVGQLIMRNCSEQMKRVTLELGGKSPILIFADADIEAAARAAAFGVFFNTGQNCCATTRILIERPVYDKVVQIMLDEFGKIRMGDPMDPNTTMGPLISKQQLDRVLGYIKLGKEEGASILCGGEVPSAPYDKSFFVEPTLFTEIDNKMRISQEEIFGPVAGLMAFDTPEEAVEIANDTDFGLAAGIWTKDVRKAQKLSRAINAGSLWVNTTLQSSSISPWGGMKNSGMGRDNAMQVIDAYTETKSIWVDSTEI